MAKKHYCQKCQKLIEEGKQIKFGKVSNYYSRRYSSGPRNYATYYLCPECYQQQEEEIQAKNEKTWKQVGWVLLILVIVMVLFMILFLLYQYHRDKKIDRITKKVQKK